MAIVSSGRAARTDFVRLARFDSADLLRAHLHTGRTHQIRVHLASIGHPVVGDDTYGGGGGRRLLALPPKRHFLHAAWLIFPHPETGALVELRSPLPADLRHSLARASGVDELPAQPDPLDDLEDEEHQPETGGQERLSPGPLEPPGPGVLDARVWGCVLRPWSPSRYGNSLEVTGGAGDDLGWTRELTT